MPRGHTYRMPSRRHPSMSAACASVWVMVEYWLHDQSAHSWPGIAGVIQTSCLTVSATVFFIGRESGGSRNAAGAF